MKKLFNRLLFYFVPLVILPTLIIAVLSITLITDHLKKSFQARLERSFRGTEIELQSVEEDLVKRGREIVSNSSLVLDVKEKNRQQLLLLLTRLIKEVEIDIAEILTISGEVLAEGHNPSRFGHNEGDRSENKSLFINGFVSGISKADRGLGISVEFLIKDDDEPVGVLILSRLLDLSLLAKIEEKFELKTIVYDGNRLQTTTFENADILLSKNLLELRNQSIAVKEKTAKKIYMAEDPYFVIIEPFMLDREIIGELCLVLPAKEVEKSVASFVATFFVSIILLISLSFYLMWHLSQKIVSPILKLSQASQKIAKGELGHKVSVSENDEIGVLATSFNLMSSKLQNIIEQLQVQKNELEKTVRELSDAQKDITREKTITDSLIESLPGLFFLLDQEGVYLRRNNNHELITGYTSSELDQKVVLDMFKNDKERIKKKIKETITVGQTVVEASLVTKDGKEIPFWLRANRIDIDSQPCLIWIGIDLTELKEAQGEIRKFSRIVEQSPNIIIITDPEGNVEFMNPAFSQVSGYSYEEMIGKVPPVFKPDVMPDHQYLDLWKTIRKGEIWQGEVVNKKKNGERYWEAVTISPVVDDSNTISHYLAIIEDISKQKKDREALALSKVEAERALQVKSVFLANMSHEIRTPMNSVIGYLDLSCEDPFLSEDTRKYLLTANRSAKNLLNIINDILDVSKLEGGKLVLESISFNVRQLINEVLASLEIKSGVLNMRLNVAPEVAQCYLGDPTRLRQVLLNLVGNAIKFTKQGGVTVEVKPARCRGELHFAVIDTGIGIPAEQLDTILAPFTQADSSTSRNYGGTGLGTTISRQLIELMDGQMWVESEVGQGTAFYFTIQLSESKDSVASTPDGERVRSGAEEFKPISSQRIFHVLLAEDIKENADLVRTRLEQQGHHVTHVWDGQQAVDAYTQKEYDIILMDVQMPIMDGLEATRLIRLRDVEVDSQIRIIALTASVMPEEIEDFFASGIDRVLGKPVDFADLFAMMEEVVPEGKGEIHNEGDIDSISPQAMSLAAMLNRIPGIDIERGVEQWQTVPGYIQALQQFAEKQINIAHSITKLLGEGKLREGQQLSHSLKGLSGNLALDHIHGLVSKVDTALLSENQKEAMPQLTELSQVLQVTVNSITSLQLEDQIDIVVNTEIDPLLIVPLFKKLLVALDLDDPSFAEPIVEQLSELLPRKDMGDIIAALKSFDFIAAKRQTYNLAEKMQFKIKGV